MSNATLAFIGAGNLTRALVAGLLSNHFDPSKIWVTNRSPEKLESLRQQFGVHITQDNQHAVLQADVVILAVKPVHMQAVCAELKPAVLQRRPLLISVAVGATTALIAKWLDGYTTFIRAMPNTPVTVGAGMTGLYADPTLNAAQKELAESVFRTVGSCLWVEDEQQLDLVCAISGCGPGYIFLIMEAIAAVAQQQGLSPSVVRLLTAQTFLGAARLALESELPFSDLRRQVASPKGVTEKIIQVLEQHEIRRLFEQALAAARQRMAEISQELEG